MSCDNPRWAITRFEPILSIWSGMLPKRKQYNTSSHDPPIMTTKEAVESL